MSRLVVDPERFLDDALEPMSAHGMGVVYTHGSDGTPYRQALSDAHRVRLIESFYVPHWRAFSEATVAALDANGRCLIIDAHSFPSRALPVHAAQYGEAETADICIGTDEIHTPKGLCDAARAAFKQQKFSVSIDTPFTGTVVPQQHYQKDKRVQSIMVEVNRRLYMDEKTGDKSSGFSITRTRLHNALAALIDTYRRM